MRKALLIGLFLLPGLLVEASAADSTASLGAQIEATLVAIRRTAADVLSLRRQRARANSVAPVPGRGGASGSSTAPVPGGRGNSAPDGTPIQSDAVGDGGSTTQEMLNGIESAYADLEQRIESLYNELVRSAKNLGEVKRKLRDLERNLKSLKPYGSPSMFALLLAYQKLVQREAEAEQELARAEEELQLLQAEAKLDADAVPQARVIRKTGPVR